MRSCPALWRVRASTKCSKAAPRSAVDRWRKKGNPPCRSNRCRGSLIPKTSPRWPFSSRPTPANRSRARCCRSTTTRKRLPEERTRWLRGAENRIMSNRTHVVIVGGGFAGLNCACQLAPHKDVKVTLIDRNNYQQFQPLLYQVACALLAPSNAAFPLRNALHRFDNVDVKMAEVASADLATRTVRTS